MFCSTYKTRGPSILQQRPTGHYLNEGSRNLHDTLLLRLRYRLGEGEWSWAAAVAVHSVSNSSNSSNSHGICSIWLQFIGEWLTLSLLSTVYDCALAAYEKQMKSSIRLPCSVVPFGCIWHEAAAPPIRHGRRGSCAHWGVNLYCSSHSATKSLDLVPYIIISLDFVYIYHLVLPDQPLAGDTRLPPTSRYSLYQWTGQQYRLTPQCHNFPDDRGVMWC